MRTTGEDDVDLTGAAKKGITQGTIGANVAVDAEAGGPVGKLAFPHGQDGKRGHDEGGGRAREEKGNGLQRLAEAHIVGKADTKAMRGGLHEPADTLGLVGAEHLAEGQIAGGGRGHLAQEVLHGLSAGGDAERAGKQERQRTAFGKEGRAEGFEGAAEGIEVDVAPFALDEGEGFAGVQDGAGLGLGNLNAAEHDGALDTDLLADHLDGGLMKFGDGGFKGGGQVDDEGGGAESGDAFSEESGQGGGVPRLREGQQGRDGDGLAQQTERGDGRLGGFAASPGLHAGEVEAKGVGQGGVGERKGGVGGAECGKPSVISGEEAGLGGLGAGEGGAGARAHPEVGQGVDEPRGTPFGQQGGLPTGLTSGIIDGCNATGSDEAHDTPPHGDGLLNLGREDDEGRLQPGVEALQNL